MAKELNFLAFSHGIVPMDDEARLWLSMQKKGTPLKLGVKIPRNGKFFAKWWSLIQCAFDWWQPCSDLKANGKEVQKNIERFRKDMIIRTGRYHMVVNTKNEVKAEADSIAWANMDELEFQSLYNDTITQLLKILPSHIKEEDLRNAEQSILEYA